MVRLTFLGSGSAFTVGDDNYQSNLLLESPDGQKLLIDCGSDARRALWDAGYTYRDIDAVYISHLHADHVGGLEWLGFTTQFDKAADKVKLYLHESLVNDIWDHVLSGGLSSLEGEVATIDSFFIVNPISKSFSWENIEFQLIQTIHAMAEFTIIPSFGLYFKTSKNRVYITTDTQFAPIQIIKFYELATIIFQDCETSEERTNVHATYDELITLPEEIKRKMWLYHYNPGPRPDPKKDGFLGFVRKGQKFDL